MAFSVRRLLQGAATAFFVARNLRRHKHTNALRGTGPACIPTPLVWRGFAGDVQVNGRPFHVKGVNWFGLETEGYAPKGLNIRTMDQIFQFMQSNKFNALRLPFSLKLALDYDSPVPATESFLDQDLHGLTKRQLMKKVVEKAAEYQMVVLLDMHRLNDAFIPQLWYSEEFPIEDVLRGWDVVLGDLKNEWNVFGVDLKNEPSGSASWGDASPETDWKSGAEIIGKHILEKHTDWNGLLFVEGINFSRDFRGFSKHPIDYGNAAWNQRVILSPHVYGPSVSHSPLFQNETFPANMPDEWTAKWGYLSLEQGKTVVIGEWGGWYQDLDKVWQDAFADYLVENCFTSTFTWDLNPDSEDTGGLLKDDWVTPEVEKLAVLARVQPAPSLLSISPNGKDICYTPGSYAAPHCVK